jgi:hypothetical protein
VIAGLPPQVSRGLDVSQAAAGWLISGYALSVSVGAIVLTAAATGVHRKAVLVGLTTLFVAGKLLTAVAPGYGVAMLGRVVAAVCHGSFFGTGSLVARRMVPPERASRAVAVMFAGLVATCAGRAVRGSGRRTLGLACHVLGDHRDRRAGHGGDRGVGAGPSGAVDAPRTPPTPHAPQRFPPQSSTTGHRRVNVRADVPIERGADISLSLCAVRHFG